MAKPNASLEFDRAIFERDGVVALRGILTPEEIAGLRTAVDAQVTSLGQSATAYDLAAIARQTWSQDDDAPDTGPAARFDMSAMKAAITNDPHARPLIDGDTKDGGMFFYDAANWRRQPQVRDVAFDSRLPASIAGLLTANHLHFWEDTTFVKAPGTGQRTAFHQDLAYFQIAGDQCAIVWIPLDPVCAANGTMEYVRGSHKWDQTFAPNVFFAQTPFASSPFPRCPDIEGARENFDIVSFDAEPGDVLVHHVRTIHGAGGNLSQTMRRAVSFRYCGDQVRYGAQEGNMAQVGLRDALRNGDSLQSQDYPIVWPKPWPDLKLSPLFPLQS
jgi:ectoine hydroxylase-related dioxygenase (phytanoyl-CoA dioxygenase family)